jgi:hypothetical protein
MNKYIVIALVVIIIICLAQSLLEGFSVYTVIRSVNRVRLRLQNITADPA